MLKKDIKISTIPVSIKIVEVGNKKLTISVFNQIPIEDFHSKWSKAGFIGWIKYKESKWILFQKNGTLLKDKVNYISREIFHKYKEANSGRYMEEYDQELAIENYNKAETDFKDRYQDLLDNINQVYISI